MMQNIALAGALLASYHTNAVIIMGTDQGDEQVLFNNRETNKYPNAVDKDGTAISVAQPYWTIVNRSYIDEDTGYEYIELINKLTLPILADDFITFHIEFYDGGSDGNASAPTSNLFRDGFECSLTKQLTTDFWDTTTKDIYVRTTETTAPVDDYNNSVELNGQDWFVYEADSERGDADHLCTTSGDTAKGIQCDSIKCTVRRKMVTEDLDDVWFTPGDTGTTMKIPAGYSYILMNQNDSTTLAETSKQRLNTMQDATVTIKKNALAGTAISLLASIGAAVALTAF